MLVAGASALALLAGPPARAASEAEHQTNPTHNQAHKQDNDTRNHPQE
jgi:hypothetical protein